MSLPILPCTWTLVALGAGALIAAAPAGAAPIAYSCPLKLGDAASEKLPDGWWRGVKDEAAIDAPAEERDRLAEIWVVAGKRGDEKVEAPAILVPDRDDGGWDLSAETDGVLIVCNYRGTNAYYATALPPGIQGCLATGEFDDKTMTMSDGTVTCE